MNIGISKNLNEFDKNRMEIWLHAIFIIPTVYEIR